MNMSINNQVRIGIRTIIILLAALFASCGKESLNVTELPFNKITATDTVRVAVGNFVGYEKERSWYLLPNTAMEVTAITDSVAVCINNTCGKLYKGETLAAKSLSEDLKEMPVPYFGLPADYFNPPKISVGY